MALNIPGDTPGRYMMENNVEQKDKPRVSIDSSSRDTNDMIMLIDSTVKLIRDSLKK